MTSTTVVISVSGFPGYGVKAPPAMATIFLSPILQRKRVLDCGAAALAVPERPVMEAVGEAAR
jgi:hypothetical protein